MADISIGLDDKWTKRSGRIFINGTQALARLLLEQKHLDEKAGLNTAGFVSGYRGSPLGNVDTALWAVSRRLDGANIRFLPGVNEDLAATAIWGTQQIDNFPDRAVDGVFALWYGKGPGVDRSIDVLKHANYDGTHKNGGVLACYGDDHGGKSSTVSHHSEQAMAAAMIPSLYPADVGEIIEYGLMGFALSRYSGSWVGMKLVNEVAEQTLSTAIALEDFPVVLPPYGDVPLEGIHIRPRTFSPLRDEQIVTDYRLGLIQDFVRANSIDRTLFRAEKPALGLVTAGKSYNDARQALSILGLNDDDAASLGISLYKIGCIWPLESEGLIRFAQGHKTLFVIEEKKSFVELQAAAALVNLPERPMLIGKLDEQGEPLLSSVLQLEPVKIALAIAERLRMLGVDGGIGGKVEALREQLSGPASGDNAPLPRRSPYFCSGCPHNRSTKVPDGSMSMTGIGCHAMAMFTRPDVALPGTHMGGEGCNWIGLSPYVGTDHIFQNMGDGTYYHSGLLAIRAAIAAKVNITYKILYNDAVAMTGGQPVDGPISVAEIAQQVRHEGVGTVVILSDDPDTHRGNPQIPEGTRIDHRDRLDAIQRELREIPGCTVLIYEQTCAAEKRRRRKRKTFPDPPKRLFIAKEVCEGCGDCSVQSTCVSITPEETAFGTKRRIDQSSCNKDYSCALGFCPSFITVYGAEPRKAEVAQLDAGLFDALPEPVFDGGSRDSFNIMISGIGGTGVITVAAMLGMAAHIDGKATSMFDMTGLAQKNGAVFSHVRIADDPDKLHSQRIGSGEADLLVAFDLVAALADEAAATLSMDRTRALVNSNVTPTVAFQFDRDMSIDEAMLIARLKRRISDEHIQTVGATAIALKIMGDTIASNMFLVGIALQRGLLPVSVEGLERAIELNGTAVQFNLNALRLGRLYVAQPKRFATLIPNGENALPQTLEQISCVMAERLTAYQDWRYAQRFLSLIKRVKAAEQAIIPGGETLALAVARNYGKLLAYKDEYEVARLLTSPAIEQELGKVFGDGARLAFNMAPPVFGGKPVNGRPPKREFSARWMRPALKLLARGKALRGTPFDPFGYMMERRDERAAIGGYERLVEEILVSLTVRNHKTAVELAGLIDMVRGYGPVKAEAMAKYEAALPAARKAFQQAGNDVAAAA